jgi:ubiquinone/menaquinone biosynthesis C-methylase UbiE
MQKVQLFLNLLNSTRPRLLDVGGGAGISGEFVPVYKRCKEVTILNIRPAKQIELPGVCVRAVIADARNLPFASASFEWVFSNAVIEHVGDWKDQVRFAAEVRRVASRGYFVSTPNRYFPIEPHTLLPFYQFMPEGLQRRVARFGPGYLDDYEDINLLSSRQMRQLFPEARIVSMGFPVLGNNLVAYYVRNP